MLILDNVLPCFSFLERIKALNVSYIHTYIHIYIYIYVYIYTHTHTYIFMLYIFYIKVQVCTVFKNGALITIAIVNCTLTPSPMGHTELST